MKKLKLLSTAVLLITGIITALTGAVETIMKLVDKLAPVPLLPAPMMEKSLKGIEQIIPPASNLYLGGTELIILGAVLIALSIYLNRTK